jgi:hypothetical protein
MSNNVDDLNEDLQEWWDDSEFDFFSRLDSANKIGYMYDIYCDGEHGDEIHDEFDDTVDVIDNLHTLGVTHHTDAVVIIGSNKEVIEIIANRIVMNGLILKLHSKEETDSKFKSVYNVIGVTNYISVN